jgi:hypothetical protein
MEICLQEVIANTVSAPAVKGACHWLNRRWKMAKKFKNIVQLCPVDGFLAVYRTPLAPYFELRHLLALALLESEDGIRWVSGLDETMNLCGANTDFAEYAHTSSINPEQKEVWQKRFKQ